MEIRVQGTGKGTFVPDEVNFTIYFKTKGNSYEEVLQEGIYHVERFIEEVLYQNDLKKEDMKTRNFVIKEEQKYNEETRQYEKDGYSFHQTASLVFDYNKEMMAHLLDSISKLENPPMCNIHFSIKNKEACRRNLIVKAYEDASKQAAAIALASFKTLKSCQKVDFTPFTTDYISPTMLTSDNMYMTKGNHDMIQAIENTFTPEDIVLTETLYCLWIAE